MTAKKIFKDLGFEELDIDSRPCDDSVASYIRKYNGKIENTELIEFIEEDENYYSVCLEHRYDGELCEFVLTKPLIIAINKQLEELEWL